MTGFIMKRLTEKLEARKQPALGDRITNPISEFKTVAEKRVAYNRALDNQSEAWIDANTKITIGRRGAEFNDVEFIGGFWRVQRHFGHKITRVRDSDFVLGDKLPRQEHTKFDFYRAYRVGLTCYGYYISENSDGYDYIVAKYETNRGTFWSYGKTIADARAFLAISIYDAYQDVIDAENTRAK